MPADVHDSQTQRPSSRPRQASPSPDLSSNIDWSAESLSANRATTIASKADAASTVSPVPLLLLRNATAEPQDKKTMATTSFTPSVSLFSTAIKQSLHANSVRSTKSSPGLAISSNYGSRAQCSRRLNQPSKRSYCRRVERIACRFCRKHANMDGRLA